MIGMISEYESLSCSNHPNHSSDIFSFTFLLTGLVTIGIVIITIQNSRDAIDRDSDEERFQNLVTKEVVAFDIGLPDKTGYKEENHWHRENPNSKNKNDAYLDECGKPVGLATMSLILYQFYKVIA